MVRKYRIFIGYTHSDLLEERIKIIQAISEANCSLGSLVKMEVFPAVAKSQWDEIKSAIDNCDYYFLIHAGKFGSLGLGIDGDEYCAKYIEMEFEYALQTGKSIIAFLHHNSDFPLMRKAFNNNEGLLVTSSYFTKKAVAYTETIQNRMKLIDYNGLFQVILKTDV